MKQRSFLLEVAQATGESLRTIQGRGFSIVNLSCSDEAFDPEPNQLDPQLVDWDEIQTARQLRS